MAAVCLWWRLSSVSSIDRAPASSRPRDIQFVTTGGEDQHANAPDIPVAATWLRTATIGRARIDPGAPNRGSTEPRSGHWNIWGIGVLVLSAGCYELDVTWSGGGWRTIYAADA